MAWRNVNRPKIHIEDLSFDAVRRIGMMLDATQDWRILAAELGYGQFEVEELARAPMSLRSSTEQLLQRWRCNKYPTLEEVCAVFIKLGFGGALDIILPELPSDARQRVVDLRTFGSDPPPSYSTSVTPDATEFLEEELPDPPPLTTGGHKPVASNGTADSEPRSEKLKAAPCTSNNPAPQEYVCVPVQSLQSKEIQNLLYSFSDIMTFTNTMECMLDQGTFGKLFKGKKDGKQVVVKMLYRENVKHCDMFLKEVVGLTKFQVPNIVQLLGICMEGPDRYLIYPYYKNGSLKDCLLCKGNRNPLPWSIRCTILIGIANGINYLHNSGNRPFIHGALKSCNVLLDDGLEAQISDLGQAQEVNRGTDGVYTHVTKQSHSETATTVAYLPNEYFTSNRKFSIKTDVYSFGIVALEVGTAMPAFDGEKTLIDIASKAFAPRQSCSSVLKIKDPNCPIWPENLYLKLMEIAEHCTAMQKSDRPIISQVHLDLLTLQDEVEHHIARTMLDNEDPMFPTVSSTDESTSMTSEHPVSSISSDSAEELNKTLQNFHLSSASSTSSLDLGICSKDSDARTAMCSCDYEYDYDEDTVEDCGDEGRECTNTEQSQYSFEGLDLNEPTFQYTNEDAMHQILKEEDLKKCGDEQYKNKSINF